jgi:hypothetical protein
MRKSKTQTNRRAAIALLLIEGREAAINSKGYSCASSSGKDCEIQEASFPELFRDVAEVLGQASDETLPGNLRRADRSVSRKSERNNRSSQATAATGQESCRVSL